MELSLLARRRLAHTEKSVNNDGAIGKNKKAFMTAATAEWMVEDEIGINSRRSAHKNSEMSEIADFFTFHFSII